jgi:hypothetical protein
MKAKGWEVSRGSYDFDRDVHAWRHDVRSRSLAALRISRWVTESYPAFVVIYHLDQLEVAQAATRNSRLLLRRHRPADLVA